MLYILRNKIDKYASNFKAMYDTCKSTNKLQKVHEYLRLALGELYSEEQIQTGNKRFPIKKALLIFFLLYTEIEKGRIKITL